MVQRLLSERRGRAGNHLHHWRRIGRGVERRHAYQRGAQGRRQPVRRRRQGARDGCRDRPDDYVKQFLTVPPGIDYEYQINPSYGGPIKRDSLRRYLSYRYNGYQRFLPGAVFADGSPVPTNPMQGNYSLVTRVTWQATQANKFRVYLDRQYNGEQYNNPIPRSRRKLPRRRSAAAGRRR